jgi:two-component system, cell cycle response regulator DivK
MKARPEQEGRPVPESLASEALDRLRRQGGEELLRALCDSFRLRTPERLQAARAALAAQDLASVARAFHSLKSSAALVGARSVEAGARAAELSAERADAAGVEGHAADIERAFAELLPELTALGGDVRPPAPAPALRRLALVEDNEDNRLLARVLLSKRFALDEYGSGIDALAGILRSPPDLVLLDLSLPGMDGLEVLAGLRAEPSLAGLPVMAVTAHAMHGDRERLFAAGFDDYVAKPILDGRDFLRRVERLLEGRP